MGRFRVKSGLGGPGTAAATPTSVVNLSFSQTRADLVLTVVNKPIIEAV